ncbi:hypothetical protein AB0J38_26120 [Streptomyces sp. NPDC050095]|uniref:hypothetical protein n=1 Tax=unclassified Streptomyces TaxID=2593676 RepID=UPI0034207685
MSDSIRVRVVLDAYGFAHPGEKQTAVHVQIPEVARATYILPAERYLGLKDRAWPEVLDVAHEHYERGWTVTDSASEMARKAIATWLRDDTNRDEMQATWELDQARRHPVARTLHAEIVRLRTRVAELEAERAEVLRQEATNLRRIEREGIPRGALGTRHGVLKAALILDERAEDLVARKSADRLTALLAPTQALTVDEPGGAS